MPCGCRRHPLADGIHLIVVQGADGSLVVGDSHHDRPADTGAAGDHDQADSGCRRTAFALGAETMADLLGRSCPPHVNQGTRTCSKP